MTGLVVDVHCPHCGRTFPAPKSMVGGHANCPDCGKAAPVEGLRDPVWRLWQLFCLVGIAGAAALAYHFGGTTFAVIAAFVGAAVLWLVSRAF